MHDSTGNVFEDLGLANPRERLAKAELARVIRKVVRERGLAQSEAAALLAEKRPDTSA
ncbi:MAG: XRE family transcriptional regulator [Longimicrobiaceae bacterium]